MLKMAEKLYFHLVILRLTNFILTAFNASSIRKLFFILINYYLAYDSIDIDYTSCERGIKFKPIKGNAVLWYAIKILYIGIT